MKAHSETHFENENMFLERWKLINPFLKKLQLAIGNFTMINEVEPNTTYSVCIYDDKSNSESYNEKVRLNKLDLYISISPFFFERTL